MPPDLIEACETVAVGPDLQMVSAVPDKCFRTGGMIYQVVERDQAVVAGDGKVPFCKMAVVIFNPHREPLFPPTVPKLVASICGGCIQQQFSESNEPGLVVDLTDVAICMTDLASKPFALGDKYQPGRPRAVGVFPKASSQGSFDSPCCGSHSTELLSDSPAQAFGSGHVIANAKYKHKGSIYLFIFMLPSPANMVQPVPLPAGK